MAVKRKLSKKQIKAGFGGKRRQNLAKHTKSKVTHHKTKATTKKKKSTKKKSSGTSGIIAHNAVLNDLIVGAGAAALGYGVKTFQDNFGAKGIAQIVSGGISAVKNAITYLQGNNNATETPVTNQVSVSGYVGSVVNSPVQQQIQAQIDNTSVPAGSPVGSYISPVTGLLVVPGMSIDDQMAEYNATYGANPIVVNT